MTDPHAAVNAAGRLAATVRDASSQAAQVRAESVRRLQEAEHMSLSELARRIGVSKARANQLIHAAPGPPQGQGDADRGEPQLHDPAQSAHTAERKPESPDADRSNATPQGGCTDARHLAWRKPGAAR
jgi:hypothetical protein